MHLELPVLSFFCVALLAVFIPTRRVRSNVANLAIVSWLVGCNLVRGINALVWAGNVNMSVPVWCDIVTRLLLAVIIAIPGACLSISRHLELVSSHRKISSDRTSIRNRMLIDLALCYVLPIIYMALHYTVQDHRFDLVKDLGCSASIHPSMPASLIMWIPPLCLCGLSFGFSAVAIHNSFRQASARFSQHLESRSNMTSSFFMRRLIMSVVMTILLAVICVFSMFFTPSPQPWTSLASIHAHITEIDILTSQDGINAVHLGWWTLFSVSLVYIIFSFSLGEEARDAFKWIRAHLRKLFTAKPSFTLPSHYKPSEMVSRASSLSRPQPRPQTVELKSGWDDMLDVKPSRAGSLSKKPKAPSSSLSQCPSPCPSNQTASTVTEDEVFMANTLAYLGSPMAQSLGISTPVLPAPVFTSPTKTSYHSLSAKAPSRHTPSTSHFVMKLPPKSVPVDAVSTISSVLEVQWPVPPVSPTRTVAPSRHGSSHSRSHSPASSAEETFGYALFPAITPPHLRSRPFEGSSISSLSEVSHQPISSPVTRKKTLPKRPSLRGLNTGWSRDKLRQAEEPKHIIHMTVLKETETV